MNLRRPQRGGFLIGMVVGLLIGLAASLAVALYVTKVPVPFINRVQQRTAEQDAAEAERNRNWDPNAPLGSRQRAASAPVMPPPPVPAGPAVATTAPVATRPALPAASVPGARLPAASAPATAALSARSGADPFLYFVQAGAYARPEDAEQQRAKLAMLGHGAKVTEREQSGRTMYRVRVGPFEQKGEAEGAQQRLADSGVEAALVRVQR